MENRSTAIGANATTGDNTLGNQMDQLLGLLDQTLQGDVTTAAVETAVSDVLTTIGAKDTAVKSDSNEKKNTKRNQTDAVAKKSFQDMVDDPSAATTENEEGAIQQDLGNYDDSSDEDEDDDKDDDDEDYDTRGKEDDDDDDDDDDYNDNDTMAVKNTFTLRRSTRKRQFVATHVDDNSKNKKNQEGATKKKRGRPPKNHKTDQTIKKKRGRSCNKPIADDNINKKSKGRTTTKSRSSFIPPPPPNYDDIVSQIPLGKEGAKMMTSFGDGPYPDPKAIEKALLGTRKALQLSIMDARKIRRRLQKEYQRAQNVVLKYDPLKNKAKPNPTKDAAEAWAVETKQSPSNCNSNSSSNNNDNNNDNYKKDDCKIGSSLSSVKKDAAMYKNETMENSNSVSQNRVHSGSIDPKLLYRALSDGTDKLSFAPKCGFHAEELEHLYPEEMRAYQRWTESYEEYEENKSDDKEKAAELVGEDDTNAKPTPTLALKEEKKRINEPDGGHLQERAAHFDIRTDKMKDDWYMAYSKVRTGSFLPNKKNTRRTKMEIEWDRLRRIKHRHNAGEWENMSGRQVRFLHWLGFNPPNLYPPDDETTQALAFLAYDRLGRIVEKAIFLRNERMHDSSISNCALWELPKDEQLSLKDVEQALEHPDVKPAAVYGTEDLTGPSSVQLYFGPGWEDRLELEMEE